MGEYAKVADEHDGSPSIGGELIPKGPGWNIVPGLRCRGLLPCAR